jgi:hypothetical protein
MDEVPGEETWAVISNSLLLLFFIEMLARERCRIVPVQICDVQPGYVQAQFAFLPYAGLIPKVRL